ncbi:MAG: DUF4265 domain-containing protein [Bacteroidia bacterium]|nr:DUF4265 domain-containing protein [Bacteroidia bacterium]
MKMQLSSQDDVNFELVLIAPEIKKCQDILVSEKYFAIIINKELGIFQIENIPFFNRHVAYKDIIYAEFDQVEGCYKYVETIEKSGNVAIAITMLNPRFNLRNYLSENDLDIRIEEISFDKFSISTSIKDIDEYIHLNSILSQLEKSGTIQIYI